MSWRSGAKQRSTSASARSHLVSVLNGKEKSGTVCRIESHSSFLQQRQRPLHFRNYLFPFALGLFGRFPTPRTPLLFPLARQRDGEFQLLPNAFCQFGRIEFDSPVLNRLAAVLAHGDDGWLIHYDALVPLDPTVLAVPRSTAKFEENRLGDAVVIANMKISIERSEYQYKMAVVSDAVLTNRMSANHRAFAAASRACCADRRKRSERGCARYHVGARWSASARGSRSPRFAHSASAALSRSVLGCGRFLQPPPGGRRRGGAGGSANLSVSCP